jgi:hypothetical protein
VQPLLVLLGSASLTLLVVGLALAWSAPVAAALGLIGAEYALRFATGPRSLDAWTPLYAGGLLLAAELAYWSVERRIAVHVEPAIVVRRAGWVIAVSAAGTALAAALLVAAGLPIEGGTGLEAIGVIAAGGVLGLAAAAAARLRVRH